MVIRRFFGAVATGVAVLACGTGAAQAQTINFDFEDQAATWTTPDPRMAALGAPFPFQYSKSGVTLSIYRNQTSPFDIVNNVGGQAKVPQWGARSLDPYAVLFFNDYFIFNLSTPVSAVMLDFGDYGFDTNTGTLTLFSGMNGTGAILGSSGPVPYLITQFVDETFATAFASTGENNISSFTFVGTSSDNPQYNQGLFLDNIRVTIAATAAVPEPGTVALLAPMLLGGIAFSRRR
jgi:hypothetical protein